MLGTFKLNSWNKKLEEMKMMTHQSLEKSFDEIKTKKVRKFIDWPSNNNSWLFADKPQNEGIKKKCICSKKERGIERKKKGVIKRSNSCLDRFQSQAAVFFYVLNCTKQFTGW